MKIKRKEKCIVGLPSCGYVFNSSRSCFIAYGFRKSTIEMGLLRKILKEKNIEVFEAGNIKEPAKYMFCTKICSKIITSQFCIALLNEDNKEGIDIPNANVNMEYGLMLGFNKYIIPFQREEHNLASNISNLETIKYNNENFEKKAEEFIENAIERTSPEETQVIPLSNIIQTFCLSKDVMLSLVEDEGTRNLYELGRPLGFDLLNDFYGFSYIYIGIFNITKMSLIKWRIQKLIQAVKARFSSIREKLDRKMITSDQASNALDLADKMKIWIIVQDKNDKDEIVSFTKDAAMKVEIFTEAEVYDIVKNLGSEFDENP